MIFVSYATVMLIVLGTSPITFDKLFLFVFWRALRFLWGGDLLGLSASPVRCPWRFSKVIWKKQLPVQAVLFGMIFTTKNHWLMCLSASDSMGLSTGQKQCLAGNLLKIVMVFARIDWLGGMHLYFNVFYTGSTRGGWTLLWRHDLVYRVRHSKTPAWSACFRLLTWNPPRPMICSVPWVGSWGPSVSWRFCNLHHLQEELQCYSINVTESKLSLCGTPTNYRYTWYMYIYIHTSNFKWREIHLSSRFLTGWKRIMRLTTQSTGLSLVFISIHFVCLDGNWAVSTLHRWSFPLQWFNGHLPMVRFLLGVASDQD